jgi:hypothetical protein
MQRSIGAILFVLSFALTATIATAQGTEKPGADRVTGDQKQKPSGIVLFNPANNHHYQSFKGDMTWAEARKRAARHTFNGVRGHLATITSQEEYDFLVNSLFVYDHWIGGYRDPAFLGAPDFGWRWITGEAFSYANWNEGAPANQEEKPHVLSFYTGSMKWSAHDPSGTVHGYVVEYPTDGPVGRGKPNTPPQEIDKFLGSALRGYSRLRTYSATIEFNFKAFRDTIENIRATILMQSDGQFRMEGRGENGKLLAISDGRRLMLALTAPGERMKFVVKPMPRLSDALKQAFSLLTSSPKPPGILDLITGALEPKIYSGKGIVGEFIEGDTPEQALRAKTTVRMRGQDPMDGDIYLTVAPDRMLITRSELSFRYKAYPFSVRETHSDIKINDPIPGNNFVLVITTNAEQVDDLGEGDEIDVTFTVPKNEK